ncbi:MAG: UDP-N-acetylmuramoyl-L-alanine--D-glutamate ligase [Clostridia bacterium]|nr:UDP-N-acetylmuramoyl-L-alanine--D-glutamate ligase [Clostridia bacterium]
MTNKKELSERINRLLGDTEGKAVLLGMGVSNLPLAAMLKKRLPAGALTVRDGKSAEALLPSLEKLFGGFDADVTDKPVFEYSGVRFVLGAQPADFSDAELDLIDDKTVIFRSPGIRPDAGRIPEATARGALLTSEMEWFCSETPADIIAVTGSDGKTTTTTLTHLLISGSGRQAYVGGNIGTPLLDRADGMKEGDFAVLELSSFQLQTMSGPAVRAAITNISPNHLNWHTDMDEYTNAKYHVFGENTELLVLNAMNPLSRAAADVFGGHVTFFTARNAEDATFETLTGGRPDSSAVWLKDGYVVFSDGQTEEKWLKVSDIKLPGIHNIENYMTAAALTRGIRAPGVLEKTAASFGGVEHRFELVRVLRDVKYYNSSIDSSPSRTVAALSNLDCRPVVICGGRDKHVPFDPLAEALLDRASAVVLTGEAAEQIKSAIIKAAASREEGGASLTGVWEPEFESAARRASELAKAGSAVILSPGCTSFDRFANFEERGRYFKKLVSELE